MARAQRIERRVAGSGLEKQKAAVFSPASTCIPSGTYLKQYGQAWLWVFRLPAISLLCPTEPLCFSCSVPGESRVYLTPLRVPHMTQGVSVEFVTIVPPQSPPVAAAIPSLVLPKVSLAHMAALALLH